MSMRRNGQVGVDVGVYVCVDIGVCVEVSEVNVLMVKGKVK